MRFASKSKDHLAADKTLLMGKTSVYDYFLAICIKTCNGKYSHSVTSSRHSLKKDLWTNIGEISGDKMAWKQALSFCEAWICRLITLRILSKATKANVSDERQWYRTRSAFEQQHSNSKSIRWSLMGWTIQRTIEPVLNRQSWFHWKWAF